MIQAEMHVGRAGIIDMRRPLPHVADGMPGHGTPLEAKIEKKFAVTVVPNPELTAITGKDQQMVVTDREFAKGALLYEFTNPTQEIGDKFTFQVGPGEHVEPDELGQNTNHSCEASARVNHVRNADGTVTVQVFAKERMTAGEQVTLDYDTMEEKLYEPIPCGCGSPECRGLKQQVRGWNYLDPTLQDRFIKEGIVAPYLVEKYWAEKSA